MIASEQGVNTPFVVAFAIIALVLAVLITASVVSAAVVASYRRIGVLKSIGFTPAQVAATYLAQIGIPALAGAIAGTVLGNWWVLPLLNGASPFAAARGRPAVDQHHRPAGHARADRAGGAGPGAAGRAAVRGGGDRRRAGAPGRARVRRAPARRPAAAAPAGVDRPGRPVHPPRPLGGHPGRGHVRADRGGARDRPGHLPREDQRSATQSRQTACVGVGLPPGQRALTPRQQQAIAAALRAQPGTLSYVAMADPATASVPGVGSHVPITAYRGDATGLGWDIVSGTWYTGPGQVVVNTARPGTARLAIGQTIRMTVGGTTVTARITGEVYAPRRPCSGALLTSGRPSAAPHASLAVRAVRGHAHGPASARGPTGGAAAGRWGRASSWSCSGARRRRRAWALTGWSTPPSSGCSRSWSRCWPGSAC